MPIPTFMNPMGISSPISSPTVFGVEWDYSNPSTALTRLTVNNDPNGYIDYNVKGYPNPAIGTDGGCSPFDRFMPWAGMDEFNIINNAVSYQKDDPNFSRSANDTVVRIPRYWYKIEQDVANSKIRFYIANIAADGFAIHPAFNRGDGVTREAIYIGKYNSGAGYVSKSGLVPLSTITRATARTNSANKGANWWQYDYAAWCAIWLLYLVEFSDWNSQSKIGQGNVVGTSVLNNGKCDSLIYHTGRAAGTDNQVAVQYRWIENLWGNIHDFADGFNANNRLCYICLNPANFADNTTTNYISTGITIETTTGSFIKGLGLSTIFPFAFLPTKIGGSAITYIPDYMYSGTGWRILMLGGSNSNQFGAGLFYFASNQANTFSNAIAGSRLMFLP